MAKAKAAHPLEGKILIIPEFAIAGGGGDTSTVARVVRVTAERVYVAAAPGMQFVPGDWRLIKGSRNNPFIERSDLVRAVVMEPDSDWQAVVAVMHEQHREIKQARQLWDAQRHALMQTQLDQASRIRAQVQAALVAAGGQPAMDLISP